MTVQRACGLPGESRACVFRSIRPARSSSFANTTARPSGPSPRSRPKAQDALNRDLVELQSSHNVATQPDQTDTPAEYLEVHAWRLAETDQEAERLEAARVPVAAV